MQSNSEQSQWVRDFFHTSEKLSLVEDDDYVADTFVSSGAVILAAAVTGDRTSDHLARCTQFPIEFVELVLALMDEATLWIDESYSALKCVLGQSTDDLEKVENRLCWVLERLWTADAIVPHYDRLGELRRGVVLGGTQRLFPPTQEMV